MEDMTNEFNTNYAKFANNSGQGPNTPVISLVSNRFNWGAFGLSWIWGLFNKTFITLICIPCIFIPFGGLITLGLSIWFGIQGNKWAWQNKKWKSIEQFHNHQRKWAIASVVVFLLTFLITIALKIPSATSEMSAAHNRVSMRIAINRAYNMAKIMKIAEEKCNLTSNGLAECFAKGLDTDIENSYGNVLELKDGTVWTFTGNGSCITEGDCSISVSGKYFTKNMIIPLYAQEGNFIEIKKEDLQKYNN